MKNLLFLALMACFTLVSCEDEIIPEPIAITGDLIVNAGGSGTGQIGIFDPIVLTTAGSSAFSVRNALETVLVNGTVTIKGLNPGNYICSEINAINLYVSFQITAGETKTISINL